MKNVLVANENRSECYPFLFGDESIKNMPFYSYAETLFYCGMDQMVEGYSGGYFEYIDLSKVELTDDNVTKVSKTSFIPFIDSDETVIINTPFASQSVTLHTASLIVWFFVLEQLANMSSVDDNQERIINCYHDAKSVYCFVDIFKAELNVIYKLLD